MGGWTGKLLRVDLTAGTTTVEDIPTEWMQEYIGGRGLADRYLYEEMDPTVDALSPENKLIFATGPLTGTPVPCGARYMVVTKGALILRDRELLAAMAAKRLGIAHALESASLTLWTVPSDGRKGCAASQRPP